MKNSLRFKVFTRDLFTCQYCGRQPPKAILEVDHMVSKFDGGGDEMDNLTTSCFECNRGKSKDSVIKTSLEQKLKSEEKRMKAKITQLQVYLEFLKKKDVFVDQEIELYSNKWTELSGGECHLTKQGKKSLGKFIQKHGAAEVLEAMQIVNKKHFQNTEDMWKYFCGILKNMRLQREDPEQYERNRIISKGKWDIIAIANKKSYMHFYDRAYYTWINKASYTNEELAELIETMKDIMEDEGVKNWTQFKQAVDQILL